MGTFVSIGNGTQPFTRLLDEIKRIHKDLPQPVVVQHGRTPFESDCIEHFDFTDEAGFVDRLERCELFITHGGGGSVFSAIKLSKKPVVVPRLKAFDEIVDDHQIAFARELERQDLIVPAYDIADLSAACARASKSPRLPPRDSSSTEAVRQIGAAVAALAPDRADPICLVTPSGGHLTEVRALKAAYEDHPHHFVINVDIVEPEDMRGRTTVITVSQRDLKFFVNLYEAWQILRAQKPKVILTTGGGFSVAFTLVGKLLGIPTIYIETVAKVNIPTVTGRFMYPLADRFFYQWPYLKEFFPKGQYIGLIL